MHITMFLEREARPNLFDGDDQGVSKPTLILNFPLHIGLVAFDLQYSRLLAKHKQQQSSCTACKLSLTALCLPRIIHAISRMLLEAMAYLQDMRVIHEQT